MDATPAPGSRLEQVDAAIAAHDYPAARDAVDDLVRATMLAESAGDIDQADADRILVAAALLPSYSLIAVAS